MITPLSGIYTNVSVLDFNSLYPSIIITYNICTTTFITHDLKIKYNERFGYIGGSKLSTGKD